MLDNVSRETLNRYVDLIHLWNPKINLVSKASLADIWERHILDSTQLYSLVPDCQKWVDLGSGGGLPGIVCAILARCQNRSTEFTLVESDKRKAAFLRTAIRELDLNAQVKTERIEVMKPLNAPVLTARALADLDGLLGFAKRHLATNGVAFFPKGINWAQEFEKAEQNWGFQYRTHESNTNERSVVLEIRDISDA